MDGAGTQVGADKMALEKVVELVMAPTGSKKTRSGGLVGLGGAQPGTAVASPSAAHQGKSCTERGGKNKSHLQGRFKMATPCQAGKGEVNVEMLHPRQPDPAGGNPILKTEQRMAWMAAP